MMRIGLLRVDVHPIQHKENQMEKVLLVFFYAPTDFMRT